MAHSLTVSLHGEFGYQNVSVHISEVLGTGSYGCVVKATLDHLPCAAKILHTIFFRDDDPGAVDFARRFEQECVILRGLKHPYIVQFLGAVHEPTSRRPILLMELMEESLTGFLEKATTSLPHHTQINIAHHVALALAYLHGNNIIHRDLSSNNILLRGQGIQAKVTDFGMSKMADANPRMTRSKFTQCPGTPVFMPPEALRAKPSCTDKLDVFSLGVVIIQTITGCFPTPSDSEKIIEDESCPTGIKIIPIPELERRESDLEKVPPNHDLLPTALHCLKDRPRDRPTAAQLCQSLGQLITSEVYTASVTVDQQRRQEQQYQQKAEEKEAEIAQLQEQMRQLANDKEREVMELRCQLQMSQRVTETSPHENTLLSRSQDEKALYDAACKGDVSAVKQLVTSNVNINCTPHPNSFTPLIIASYEGQVEIVRLLIQAKANLDIQDREENTLQLGSTALHVAAQEGKAAVVRLLTEAQAQLNIQKNTGSTPLYMACQVGHSDIADILIRCGANTNLSRKTGATPLFIASQRGHHEVVRVLLRGGAGVNLASNTGVTPLYVASQNGCSEIVETLLKNGADVNLARSNGETPLFIASQNGHTEAVNVLLMNGAAVNMARNDGVTPLIIASHDGRSYVVSILLRSGADVNLAVNTGSTALFSASQNGHTVIVNTLLAFGADVNIAGFKKRKPIDAARLKGHRDIVYLLEKRQK